MSAPGRRRGHHPLVDLELALAPRCHPNPLVLLWRWRYELGLLAAALLTAVVVVRTDSVLAVLGTGALIGGGLAAWPAGRRLLAVRVWCIVTPHRVRTACAQAWIHSRSGKIPIVLWTSAQPYGERVRLWCRAGTMAADLEVQRAMLATTCWAEDARVVRSRRRPQIVTLEVVRRPVVTAVSSLPGDPGAPEGESTDGGVRLVPPLAAS
jgi:hypothetical protein